MLSLKLCIFLTHSGECFSKCRYFSLARTCKMSSAIVGIQGHSSRRCGNRKVQNSGNLQNGLPRRHLLLAWVGAHNCVRVISSRNFQHLFLNNGYRITKSFANLELVLSLIINKNLLFLGHISTENNQKTKSLP